MYAYIFSNIQSEDHLYILISFYPVYFFIETFPVIERIKLLFIHSNLTFRCVSR